MKSWLGFQKLIGLFWSNVLQLITDTGQCSDWHKLGKAKTTRLICSINLTVRKNAH